MKSGSVGGENPGIWRTPVAKTQHCLFLVRVPRFCPRLQPPYATFIGEHSVVFDRRLYRPSDEYRRWFSTEGSLFLRGILLLPLLPPPPPLLLLLPLLLLHPLLRSITRRYSRPITSSLNRTWSNLNSGWKDFFFLSFFFFFEILFLSKLIPSSTTILLLRSPNRIWNNNNNDNNNNNNVRRHFFSLSLE